MAWASARGLLVVLSGLLLAGGCTAPVAAQNHPAAARVVVPVERPVFVPATAPIVAVSAPAPASRLWPFKRLFNVDYVDVHDIGGRYELKATWVVGGRTMQLADAQGRVRLKFEKGSRDLEIDGIRVFMGENTVFNQGSLHVSRIDVIKTIVPLLNPMEHAGQLPAPPRLIVLDAGHGGIDPGARNLALHLDEKAVTLDVVLRLQKLLERRGYRVILTRGDDTKLAVAQRTDLEQRAETATRARADLFLSVHFNSASPAVTGTETYVMTPQFQASSSGGKDDVVDRPFPGNRQDFANVVLGFQLHRSLLAGLKTSDRGFKRGRLLVLCFSECPAALVEAAYLSNPAEALRLATPEFRQQIAESIAAGIDAYSAVLAAIHPAPPLPAEIRSVPGAPIPHPAPQAGHNQSAAGR
jgi:N-acetylmuramoyl-L-alanine amidase